MKRFARPWTADNVLSEYSFMRCKDFQSENVFLVYLFRYITFVRFADGNIVLECITFAVLFTLSSTYCGLQQPISCVVCPMLGPSRCY